eukprot:3445896-Alexandrium_andersonii.AAC.1
MRARALVLQQRIAHLPPRSAMQVSSIWPGSRPYAIRPGRWEADGRPLWRGSSSATGGSSCG